MELFFGGIILSYIDQAGAVEAVKNTRHKIVTVAMNGVVFHQPVRVGEVVSFYSTTTRIGRTSISVHVDVEVARGGEEVRVTEADLTFVAVGDDFRPIPV